MRYAASAADDEDDIRPDAAKRLREARESRGFADAKAAAKYFTWNYNTYSQHERGERGYRLVAEKYAKALRVSTGWLLTGEGAPKSPDVPVVGLVGAAAEASFYGDGQGPLDYVPAPDGATDKTVAVEVRGDSLGASFDGWVLFYDDRREPVTEDLLGKLCVIGLLDGRVVVKTLTRGQLPRRFNLTANVGPPIYDAEVAWAALIKQMRPNNLGA